MWWKSWRPVNPIFVLSTLSERKLSDEYNSVIAIMRTTTWLLKEYFGLWTRLINCNLMIDVQLWTKHLKVVWWSWMFHMLKISYQLKLNYLFVTVGCRKVKLKVVWYSRLLTCKVQRCMIKLNVSCVENKSYQLKLNVVFVTVECRRVKLKVVW